MERQKRYCPECGGELKYEPALKQYVCSSCGLMHSREGLEEAMSKFSETLDERTKAHKKRREALKWWLTKKEQ